MSPRAPAMSPDDRRASIVAAARPLIREHGREVTTKQIAKAAGVAEGTLFRVFDDKEAILQAVVIDAIRPEPVLAQIDALDRAAPLGDLVAELVAVLSVRIKEIFEIAVAVRWMPQEAIEPRVQLDPVQQHIVDLLTSRRAELSVEPLKAAEVLRLLIFAGTHPMINEGRPLDTEDIVAILLDGVRRHDLPVPGHPVAAPSAKSGLIRSPMAKSP